MEVFELSAGTLQVSVVKEQLQPSENLPFTSANEGADVRGTQKPMPVNEPDDGEVALGELNLRDCRSAFEAGEAG